MTLRWNLCTMSSLFIYSNSWGPETIDDLSSVSSSRGQLAVKCMVHTERQRERLPVESNLYTEQWYQLMADREETWFLQADLLRNLHIYIYILYSWSSPDLRFAQLPGQQMTVCWFRLVQMALSMSTLPLVPTLPVAVGSKSLGRTCGMVFSPYGDLSHLFGWLCSVMCCCCCGWSCRCVRFCWFVLNIFLTMLILSRF